MKTRNRTYIALVILTVSLVFSSCEENDIPLFDTENGRAIAGFNNPASSASIIFNPAADTQNVITVGVSTLSGSDRAVQLELDAANTTLDPIYYTISDLSPVIPAGEFTTDIIITTLGSPDLPESGSVITLNLNAVEGAEILSTSRSSLAVSLSVQCPEVDFASIPGTYTITVDEFETSVGDAQFEIIAGPGANQFTMVNPFDHPNPNAGGAQNYNVVIDINPDSGAVTVARQPAWHCVSFACEFGEGRVDGIGLSLTCIGQISFTLNHTVDAGSFGSYALVVQKN